MAYLKDIFQHRCADCNKPARTELFNRFNAMNGRYCKSCGKRELAKQKQREQRESAEAN